LGSNTGVPIRASSTGERTPSSERGPRFQVDGTTNWKFLILPPSISIQCDRVPRGAFTKPTPKAELGHLEGRHDVGLAGGHVGFQLLDPGDHLVAMTLVSMQRAAVRPRVENRASAPTPSA
jgi:hypothetical protein